MEERNRGKPGGPGRVTWRRSGRTRIVEKFDRTPGMLECKEYDQHGRREVVGNEDQIEDHCIDKDQRNLSDAAGKRFPYPYRECSHAFGFIVIMFVDMF